MTAHRTPRARLSLSLVAAAAGLFLLAPATLHAEPIPAPGIDTPVFFNFNSLGQNASNNAVQDYMRAQWAAAGLTGQINVHGARGERSYTGDGHVVGPVDECGVTSWTLGNTDGGVPHPGLDTFLVNSGSDRITIVFPTPIYSAEFDYEIFPNGDVPDGTRVPPSRYPDFTLIADGQVIFQEFGVLPDPNGPLHHSPFSGPINNELAPQLLATSGPIAFANGVTRLEFVDWPVLIGIDNLSVSTSSPVPTPEPASVVVLGAGLAGLFAVVRRRKRLNGTPVRA